MKNQLTLSGKRLHTHGQRDFSSLKFFAEFLGPGTGLLSLDMTQGNTDERDEMVSSFINFYVHTHIRIIELEEMMHTRLAFHPLA